jgi:hypothetical protein
MARRTVLALSLAALALAFAACGGKDDSLSKAELVTQADAICRSVRQKTSALGNPTTFAELQRLGAKAQDISNAGVDKLRELKPPDSFQDEWKRMLALAERQTSYAGELVAAAKARDQQKIGTIARAATLNAKRFSANARSNGFKSCGQRG